MSTIKCLIEFLVDNAHVDSLVDSFSDIPTGTNSAPLLADLFLYSYENEFSINLLRKAKESFLESSISHNNYRSINDLISLNNKRFLIFTPKNSPFPRLQNLLQLLLISTWFLLEMTTTTLPASYMISVMCFASTL